MTNKEFSKKAVIWSVIGIIIILIYLTLTGCEKNENSNANCCWYCTVSKTWYYPGEQPYEVTGFGKYMFCDSLFVPSEWESQNSYVGMEDGIKFEQKAACKK